MADLSTVEVNGTEYNLKDASARSSIIDILESLLGVKTQSEVLVIDAVEPGESSGGSSTYELPTASASTLGGVKIGSGITITNGVISCITSSTVQSMINSAISGITDGDEVSY